jgi:hypothetical protein
MVEVATSGMFDEEEAVVDSDKVLDTLVLKADRCSDSLRHARWSAEDISDMLGLVELLPYARHVLCPTTTLDEVVFF